MATALILYQYFHPDDVVSAVLLTELAEGLVSRGWEVTSIPSNRSCQTAKKYPKLSSHGGIKIKRAWRPPLPQSKSWGRIINCIWMLTAWSFQAMISKPDVLIIGTDPALSATIAIPWKMIRPSTRTVHWCFDLYPEAAAAEQLLPRGILLKAIKLIMAAAYRRMDLIIDIGDCMRSRLADYRSPAAVGRAWPWALAEPTAIPRADPKRRLATFGDAKLAVMYSGSFGRAHSASELINIARRLRGASVHFCLGIRGSRAAEVINAITPEDENISVETFVPAYELATRLSVPDIHVVSLRPEWTGTVVPSKFFGALASGRPVLFIGSEQCCLAELIRRFGIGWVCQPGGEPEIANQLRGLAKDPSPLREINARCHRAYNEHFSRKAVIDSFDKDLRNLVPQPCLTEPIRG